ncbi:phosphotransferase [Azospirillum sp. ST 5-10]|uniref:phosphotransferase family protein n=1 Tax=unclassified Azospirillum TaxID=2630922 RepID=UPI003F49E781
MAAPDDDLAPFRAAILRRFPELEDAAFRLLTGGWHSVAVDVDDRLVFKFPRHAAAAMALRKEAALLAIVRPSVSLAVPDMDLHDGPPLFSRHGKLPGGHLLREHYERLPEGGRVRLGADLGRFYAELHRLDAAVMAAAGAGPVEAWQPPDVVRTKAVPALPRTLRDRALGIVEACERLPADPHGRTYGFFDGHGWNMAFDQERGRLNGVYDFADSGIGPLHQDFIRTSFISPDLTERVVAAYEALTGRRLERRRIALLTGMHRLSELAELAHDPDHAPAMVRHAVDWLASATE